MWLEGRESPSLQRSVRLQPVLRLHLIRRPGDGTSGSRLLRAGSILSFVQLVVLVTVDLARRLVRVHPISPKSEPAWP